MRRQAREIPEEIQRLGGRAVLVHRLLALPGSAAGLEFLLESCSYLVQIVVVLRRGELISGMLPMALRLGNLIDGFVLQCSMGLDLSSVYRRSLRDRVSRRGIGDDRPLAPAPRARMASSLLHFCKRCQFMLRG